MARIRVLIVDDSAFMRHALGRLLERDPVAGGRRRRPRNGEEGLRLARELRARRHHPRRRDAGPRRAGHAQAAHARDADPRRHAVEPDDRERAVTPRRPRVRRHRLRVPSPPARSRSTSAASATSSSARSRPPPPCPRPPSCATARSRSMNLTLAGAPREQAAPRSTPRAGRPPEAADGATDGESRGHGLPARRRRRSLRSRRRAGSSWWRRPPAARAPSSVLVKGLPAEAGRGRRHRPAHAAGLHRVARRAPRFGRRAALRRGGAGGRPGRGRDPGRPGRSAHDQLDERPHPARPTCRP